jgi:hypothetical protein
MSDMYIHQMQVHSMLCCLQEKLGRHVGPALGCIQGNDAMCQAGEAAPDN